MRATIRGTEIFFDVDGACVVPDGPRMRERATAFLIHGGPGNDHGAMKVRYGALAEKMQLIYFDQRGHGRSARGDANKYTLDENVEDMESLRRYLGLGPIVSLGVSYGGMVAMAHAARYPSSVSHLILAVTAAHAGFLVRAQEIIAQRGTAEQAATFDDLLKGKLDESKKLRRYYEVMGPLYSLRHEPEQMKEALDRMMFSPEALNQAFAPDGFLRSFDLRPELAAITAPTLILAARHDWICAPEFSEELNRLISRSDLRVFENSGHTIAADEPQTFMDAVAGFVVYQRKAA